MAIKTIADIWRLGLPIIPERDKIPAFKGWQEKAQNATLDDLRKWWKLGYRAYGIYLKPTPLVVVDCDDEEAIQWAKLTGLDSEWRTRTRRGIHFYFYRPKDFNLKEGRISDGLSVDLKWKGKVTAPFSQIGDFTYQPEGNWEWPMDILPALPKLSIFQAPEEHPWPIRTTNIPACPMLSDLADRYISKAERSIQGANGSFNCKKAASYFVNGLGLSEEDAMGWMRKWNHECAVPEWNDRELKHAITTAYKEGPRGGLPFAYALAGRDAK